jgi:molybdopterin-guanine dinucleotide biosynthesis protein A
MRRVAVILAGGRNERFGGTIKCLQPWNGDPLIVHTVCEASFWADHVVVVTNQVEVGEVLAKSPALTYVEFDLLQDDRPFQGPLTAYAQAWEYIRDQIDIPFTRIWLIAGDMPFADVRVAAEMEQMLLRLRKQDANGMWEAVVPYLAGRWQPLNGMYFIGPEPDGVDHGQSFESWIDTVPVYKLTAEDEDWPDELRESLVTSVIGFNTLEDYVRCVKLQQELAMLAMMDDDEYPDV